jgi:hypothetical protein
MSDKALDNCSDLFVYRNTRRASRRYTPLSSPRPSQTPNGYRSISQTSDIAEDRVESLGMVSSQLTSFDWSQDDQRLNRWEYLHAHQHEVSSIKTNNATENGDAEDQVCPIDPRERFPETVSYDLAQIEVHRLSVVDICPI